MLCVCHIRENSIWYEIFMAVEIYANVCDVKDSQSYHKIPHCMLCQWCEMAYILSVS